jgi:hypothetical protein
VKHDDPLSSFAFKFILRRYMLWTGKKIVVAATGQGAAPSPYQTQVETAWI